MKRSAPARVVVVSSMGHQFRGLDLDDLNFERRTYSPLQAYASSKVANVLFAAESGAHSQLVYLATLNGLWRVSLVDWRFGPCSSPNARTSIIRYQYAVNAARRLRAEGVQDVTVNSLHPGCVRTELARYMPLYQRLLVVIFGYLLGKVRSRSSCNITHESHDSRGKASRTCSSSRDGTRNDTPTA